MQPRAFALAAGLALILLACGKHAPTNDGDQPKDGRQPPKLGESLKLVTNAENVRVSAADPKEYLLLGFDSVTGTKRNEECVKFKGREDLPPRGDNPPVDRSFSAKFGSTRRELETQIKFSNGAKLSLGFGSIGAAETITRAYTSSASHKHLLLSTVVKYDSRVIDLAEGIELTDKAKEYLANNAFFAKCGDSFIVGDVLGGEFNAIYLFSAFKNTSIRVMQAEVEAAVTAINLGAKAEFVTRMKTVSANSRGMVDVLSLGPGDTVERTYDGLWQYGTEFAARVKTNPAVVEYVVESYQSLIDRNKWVPWAEHRDAADRYASALLALRDREDSLNELLNQANSELGYVPDSGAAQELAGLQALTEQAKANLKLCIRESNCNTAEPLPAPEDRPPGPLIATYVMPSDGSAHLLTREPGVVVELLGRWTALKAKKPIVCDRVDCTLNQFVFMSKSDGAVYTSIANKTCLSPAGHDVYYRPVLTGLSKVAPRKDDPVRVLIYHPIYPKKEMCTWEPPS